VAVMSYSLFAIWILNFPFLTNKTNQTNSTNQHIVI
jgi:hypothetical protein